MIATVGLVLEIRRRLILDLVLGCTPVPSVPPGSKLKCSIFDANAHKGSLRSGRGSKTQRKKKVTRAVGFLNDF